MTILPSQSTSSALANATQGQQTKQLPTVDGEKPTNPGVASNSVKVSASYSSTVTLGGSQQRSHTFVSSGVAKYEAIAEAPKTRNPAAENILSFISNRLAMDLAEGASSEEIESRLAAALEGFMEGYGQAREQLEGSGFLSPDIENLIQDTYDTVVAGIDALAEQYAVTSPVVQGAGDNASTNDAAEAASAQEGAPSLDKQMAFLRSSFNEGTSIQSVFTQFAEQALDEGQNLKALLKGAEIDYELLASREFNFSLRTQDGDEVVISASVIRGERGAVSEGYPSANGGQVSASGFSSSQFNLSVDGELDEDELTAISDLLAQIGELSNTFFAGDIEQAFELALNIGFDSEEIAKFSLNLEQRVSTKVQAAYAQNNSENDIDPQRSGARDALNFANGNNSLSRLASFVSMLEDITYKAEELGLSRTIVPEFAGYLADTVFADKTSNQSLQAFLEKLVA